MILLINYSHKWWYKALSVLLVVALILAISFGAAPRAHAVGVLTITVCAAILAVMAGAGIATVVSGMTSADIQNWMTGKLNEWDLYRNDGNVFSDLIQNNLITTTVKGALAIGNGAARGISDFIDWLKSNLSLSNNSTINIYNNTAMPDVPVYINNTSGLYIGDINGRVYASISASYINPVKICVIMQPYQQIVFITEKASNNIYIYYQLTNGVSASSNSWSISNNGDYYYFTTSVGYQLDNKQIPVFLDINQALNNYGITQSSSLSLNTDVINIPSVADDGQTDIVIGIDGVYPGATTDEAADVIMDGVLDNTLDTTMTITDEYVDAVEAVVINEQPISVNTDHHMIGFTNLPDFVNLNLNSIWHYVSDAVEYASGFISWFVNLLSSVPTLATPLYMSFTLLIVLSFIRRILL